MNMMDEDKKIEKIYQITAKLIKALEEKDVIKVLDAIEEAYREDLVEEVSRFMGIDLTDLLSKIYTFSIAFVEIGWVITWI
jgi:formate dehydrogenase maturation protein FdhE